MLVALLVCLIPTTIGALLSAIGIAGMDRLVQRNVLAMSGRAVEAAGDVNTLLLDKTGTITLGNRQAAEFAAGPRGRAWPSSPTRPSCPAWPTRPRRAARSWCSPSRRTACGNASPASSPRDWVPFTAQTRMSGVDLGRTAQIRKGAAAAVHAVGPRERRPPDRRGRRDRGRDQRRRRHPARGRREVRRTSRPARSGVIHLKDVVKEGMRERFDEMRRMGIRTVMITGDNPLTAKAIAEEAGVDDFLAEATPEDKMELIRKEQAGRPAGRDDRRRHQRRARAGRRPTSASR